MTSEFDIEIARKILALLNHRHQVEDPHVFKLYSDGSGSVEGISGKELLRWNHGVSDEEL